jgi:hypothetical protein
MKGLEGTFGYTGAVSAVTDLLRQLRGGEQR